MDPFDLKPIKVSDLCLGGCFLLKFVLGEAHTNETPASVDLVIYPAG